jgi:hypothetical protein
MLSKGHLQGVQEFSTTASECVELDEVVGKIVLFDSISLLNWQLIQTKVNST